MSLDVDRFKGTQAYVDAVRRWLDRVADLNVSHPAWGKVAAVYDGTPALVDDLETWRITEADRWVEAEALADEPRIQSSFEDDDKRYEWDT